ncbi:MAG: gamma carbonic anhydrase family protein [Rikenellaceae bacterium]
MALVRSVRGKSPEVGEGTFLAETAVLIGDVTVGRDSSIWYGAVLRGDVNAIKIGDRTNIQDGTVIHTLYDKSPNPSQAIIGNDVSVGHNVTIHGAVIEDNCLIGMGSTILDNAVVASGCIIAANALVLSGAKLEPNSLYAGVPAKRVREVSAEQRRDIIERIAADYRVYAGWYDEE